MGAPSMVRRLAQGGQGLSAWLKAVAARLPFDPGWLAAAALPLIGIIPAISGGVILTADGPIHVHRIQAMTLLWQEGNLWPRWVPYFHLGYGYPVFNYYPPLTYHIGAALGVLGISAPAAFNLTLAGSWVVGTLGAYALARHLMPGRGAILAALLWAYAPSRLHEVWHQGSTPQMMAAAFIPWLLLALALAAARPSRRNLVALGALFAAILMSHLPLAVMVSLFLGPGVILLPLWHTRRALRRWPGRVLRLAGGLALGAGLCAIFVLPLAVELPYIQATAQDPFPLLRSNFLQLRDLLIQPYPQDLTDITLVVPTTLGLLWVLLAVAGCGALAARRQYGAAAGLAVGLAAIVFITQEASLFVWQSVPFLATARFPGRIFRIGAVFAAMAGGASILPLPRRWQGAGLAAAMGLALLSALPWTYPIKEFVWWDNLSALDEIEYELETHTWGTTSYDEFQPVWGESVPLDPAPEPEAYITNPLRLVVHRLDMVRQWPDLQVEQIDDATVRVVVSDARRVRFRQYYCPGWTATLDGQPVEVYPEPEIGLIALDVPPGEHVIHLRYTGTPVQAVGAALSLVSVGVALALAGPKALWLRLRKGRAAPGPAGKAAAAPGDEGEPLSPRAAGLILAGVAGFALLNAVVITPHTTWFRHRSPPDAPISMENAVHVFFGEQIELLGYTLHQDRVAPGGTLDVTLYWRVHGELESGYWPTVQLVNLGVSEAWAVSRLTTTLTEEVRGYDTASRFVSERHRLRAFADIPPYVGRIKVAVLDMDHGEAWLPAETGETFVLLEPLIRVEGSDPPAPRRLDYRFGDALRLTCAAVLPGEGRLDIRLYWQVERPLGQDVVALVHGLDAAGQLVAQNDSPPLGGDYPTSLWLPGQTLADHYTLPLDPAIAAVGFGLYRPEDMARLPVTEGGRPVPESRIALPVGGEACAP